MCENTYVNIQTGKVLNMERVASLKDNALLKIRPDLWCEWDFEKNDELDLDIWKMTKATTKSTWWICPVYKESYLLKTRLRVNQKVTSLFVSGHLVCKKNSLEHIYPNLAKEWHPTLNGDLTPNNVTYKASIKVWWKCKKGHEWNAEIYQRHVGTGCPTCSNKKVKIGYNDLSTTHPHIARLLANQEDGHKFTSQSGQKVDWICPECQAIVKEKAIYSITNGEKLSCPSCSSGKSFGERYMYSFLSEININFKCEKVFSWNRNRRYDFFIKFNNKLILTEIHGMQHYEDCYLNEISGITLEKQINIDKSKRDKALTNGIDYYFEIDARISDEYYLKDSIINSGLLDLLIIDKENVNWDRVFKNSHSSLVKKANDLWSSGIKDTKDIANSLKLSIVTVVKYLKIGSENGWNDYLEKKDRFKKINNINNEMKYRYILVEQKEVVQLSLDNDYIKTWDSMTQASKELGIASYTISQCLKRELGSAGSFKWIYRDEYSNLNNKEDLSKYLYKSTSTNKEVVQFSKNGDLLNHWNSIKKASQELNILPNCISQCLKRVTKTAGGFIWMYKTEYDNCIKNDIPISFYESNTRKVVQLDENLTFLNRFESISECANKTGIGYSIIYNSCKNPMLRLDGFIWVYEDDYVSGNIKISKTIKSSKRKIVQLSKNNEIIKKWDSIIDATKNLNFKSKNSIGACVTGKNKTAYGFKWMYLEQYEKQYGKIDE